MGRLKSPTSFRLSDEGRECLEHLAGRWGLSAAGVLELLLREGRRWADQVAAPDGFAGAVARAASEPAPEPPKRKRGRPRKEGP